jgi:hypothetical protein
MSKRWMLIPVLLLICIYAYASVSNWRHRPPFSNRFGYDSPPLFGPTWSRPIFAGGCPDRICADVYENVILVAHIPSNGKASPTLPTHSEDKMLILQGGFESRRVPWRRNTLIVVASDGKTTVQPLPEGVASEIHKMIVAARPCAEILRALPSSTDRPSATAPSE